MLAYLVKQFSHAFAGILCCSSNSQIFLEFIIHSLLEGLLITRNNIVNLRFISTCNAS